MAKRNKRQQKSFSRRILYWGSHALCAVVAIIAFLTLVQCTIKKPEAPSWQTNLVVPLTNKTWVMSEIIDKIGQENLTVDSLGNPLFYYHDEIDTVRVGGTFTIPNVSESVAESLGVVTLDPVAPTSFSVSLSSEFPGLPAGTFPDTSFDISETLPPLGNFVTATISSGSLVMTITNDFGLYLDTVIVTIYDDLASQQISSFNIPGGIPIGSVSSDTVDLSGKTVSNQLSVLIHCHAQEQTSFTLADKSLSSSLGIPQGLKVTSASATMPEMSKSFATSFDINSSHQVQSATLDSGRLVLDLSNNTNVATTLSITLPDFVLNGSPLVINQTVYAQQSGQYTYDLAGYVLQPTDQVLPQSLAINVDALIASSGGQIVTINAGDKINLTATVEDIELASVTGIIGETTANFDSIRQEIDIPTGFDNMQLPAAMLTLKIQNTVNIPGSFSINIDGNQGQHKTLSGTISPGLPGSPVTTVIVDSNLTSFMDPIPEVFTVTGSATFGDGSTSGSISASDYVLADVTISSPLAMIIDSSTVDGEWEDANLDIDSSVVNSLNSASFYATFENHLPVGITAEILLSNDSATVYTSPDVRLGPIDVNAGVLNPDGTVSSATIAQNVIAMDSTQIQVLHSDTLWIGELLTLHSSNGATVRMTAADYLKITGYIDLKVTFGDNLWEDN